jgi:hypothetical protein
MRARNSRVALGKKNIQPLPDLAFIYRKDYFSRLIDQVIAPYIL